MSIKNSWQKIYSFWESSSEAFVIEMLVNMDKSGYFVDLKEVEDEIPVMEESSPIIFMFNKGWFKAFDALLSYGVSVNLVSEEDGGTALFHLINNRKMWDDDERYRLVSFLLKYGADPRLSLKKYSNPVRLAAYYGDFDIYADFIKKYEEFANEELIKFLDYNQETLDKKAAMDRTKMSMLLMKPKKEDSSVENSESELETEVESDDSSDVEIIDDEDGLSLLGESRNESGLSDEELEAFLGNDSDTQDENPLEIESNHEEIPVQKDPPILKKKERKRILD